MGKKNSDAVRFGDAVRRARANAKLSQEELAHRAGLDRSYIGGVERGERNPTLIVIAKIARGLGITPAELLVRFPVSGKGG
jgi:transcriptional regulator with XRE-family HTH domain